MISYEWLKNEKAPKVLVQAVKMLGTKEIIGAKHNPVILDWAKELNLQNTYNADEIPWCGLAVAYACKSAGLEVINKPLWALSWAKWGTEVKEPCLAIFSPLSATAAAMLVFTGVRMIYATMF